MSKKKELYFSNNVEVSLCTLNTAHIRCYKDIYSLDNNIHILDIILIYWNIGHREIASVRSDR